MHKNTYIQQKPVYKGNSVTLLLNVTDNHKGRERTYTKEKLKEAIALLHSAGFEDKAMELEQVLRDWKKKPTIKEEVRYRKQTA